MSRRKPSPFQNCETREAFLDALQQQLASGKLSAVELNAAKLLCKMKGWGTPVETSEMSVTPEVESTTDATPVSGGDGFWYWRESRDWSAWNGIDAAKMPKAKPWHGPFTVEEMASEANRIAAEGVVMGVFERLAHFCCVGVKTPRGLLNAIWCQPPCTVAYLEELNNRPPLDNSHW